MDTPNSTKECIYQLVVSDREAGLGLMDLAGLSPAQQLAVITQNAQRCTRFGDFAFLAQIATGSQLRYLKAKKLYRLLGLTWENFCELCLGTDPKTVNDWLALSQDFVAIGGVAFRPYPKNRYSFKCLCQILAHRRKEAWISLVDGLGRVPTGSEILAWAAHNDAFKAVRKPEELADVPDRELSSQSEVLDLANRLIEAAKRYRRTEWARKLQLMVNFLGRQRRPQARRRRRWPRPYRGPDTPGQMYAL